MFGVFVFLYDISWGRHKCLHMLHQTQSAIHGKKHVNEAKKILLERQKEESMGPDDT